MITTRRAVLAVCIPFVLAGCASAPQNRTLKADIAAAIQPLEVQIGVKQSELYAEFEHSNIAAGAAACGAVPGLGILLAAACGGTMGAMDASINAERAKAADQQVRPLKDALVDVNFDQLFNDSILTSLRSIPRMQFSGMRLTKTVDAKGSEEVFRASKSGAVMFVNVDYHVSKDFSTVQVTAIGYVFPRSVAARTAAGKSAQLPEQGPRGNLLWPSEAAYQVQVIYRGSLPSPSAAAAGNIAQWRADDARLLRAALDDGAQHVARLLAQDMQRTPDKDWQVVGKTDAGSGLTGELLSNPGSGELVRLSSGALLFRTRVTLPTTQAGAAANPIVHK